MEEDALQTCRRGELTGDHHHTTAGEEDLEGVCSMEAMVDEGLAGGGISFDNDWVRQRND